MGYLIAALDFIKGLNPKIIVGGVLFILFVAGSTWIYFKYDIVAAGTIKDKDKIIRNLKDDLTKKETSITNLRAEAKEKESAVEACNIEKEILEFECKEIDKEDFNENIVDPNSDHLPF